MNSYFHLTTHKRFLFKFNIYLHENFILVFKIAAGATVHKSVTYKTFNIFCIYLFIKIIFLIGEKLLYNVLSAVKTFNIECWAG